MFIDQNLMCPWSHESGEVGVKLSTKGNREFLPVPVVWGRDDRHPAWFYHAKYGPSVTPRVVHLFHHLQAHHRRERTEPPSQVVVGRGDVKFTRTVFLCLSDAGFRRVDPDDRPPTTPEDVGPCTVPTTDFEKPPAVGREIQLA